MGARRNRKNNPALRNIRPYRTAFSELKLTLFSAFSFCFSQRRFGLQPGDAAAARAPGRPVVGGVHDGGREPLWLREEDRPPRPPALARLQLCAPPPARSLLQQLLLCSPRPNADALLSFFTDPTTKNIQTQRNGFGTFVQKFQTATGKSKYGVPIFLPNGNVNPAYLAAERKEMQAQSKLNIKATEAKRKKLVANKQFELADYIKKAIGSVGSGKEYYQSGK